MSMKRSIVERCLPHLQRRPGFLQTRAALLSRDSDDSDPSIDHSPTLSRGYKYSYDYDYDALRLSLPRASWNSRRHYSSTLSFQDSQDEETETIRFATNRLLDPKQTPSFDDALWTEAQHVLKWWILQPSRKSNTTTRAEVVDTCFHLLDRLEGELPKDEFLFGSLLETELLNAILVAWRKQHQVAQNTSTFKYTLLPSEVALKIDKYRWCSLVQPDAKTFNILLDAARYMEDPKEGVLFAKSLLEKLLQVSEQQPSANLLDAVTFSTVMNLWVSSGLAQGPQKAQDLLDRLQTIYSQQGWDDLQPNSVVYTTVIKGWARVGDASKATHVLQQQLKDYKHGNVEAQPDSQTFNAVLQAWAKSRDDPHKAPQQAEQVVAQMRAYQCPPDSYSFTHLLTCWANSKHASAAEKTEGILRDMLDLVESGETRIRPNIVAYNTVIHAYAQKGNAERAQELLQELLHNDHDGSVQPDEITFNTVIAAWSKSKQPEAPRRAESLLGTMRDLHLRPTVVTYSSVLQCWAKSSDRQAADRAESILKDMQQNGQPLPNIVCYNIVLNALANAARQHRDRRTVAKSLSLLGGLLKKDSHVRPNALTFRAVLHAIVGSTVQNKFERANEVIELMKQNKTQPSAADLKLIDRLSRNASNNHKTKKR